MPTRSELMAKSIEVIHQQHAVIKHALHICDEAHKIINEQHKIMKEYKENKIDLSTAKENFNVSHDTCSGEPESPFSSPENNIGEPRGDEGQPSSSERSMISTKKTSGSEEIKRSQGEYLRIHELAQLFGVAKSTLYKWRNTKGFPKPIRLSPRCSIYKIAEVREWVNQIEK